MLAHSLLGRQIRYSCPPISIDSFDIDAYEKNVIPGPLKKQMMLFSVACKVLHFVANLISRWSSAWLCLLSTVFFFCYRFPSGLCASLSPVRWCLSNKPSCRISVFFLAFQNVKIVKLLNVNKMKLLGMKFSGRTTLSVAYYSLFQKKTL